MTYDEFIASWLDSTTLSIEAHTSGSTGKPKPIFLTKEDMRLSARATIDFFGIHAGDILAIPLAADYIAGKMMAVRALESGARLLAEKPSRNPLGEIVEPIKLAAIVPQQIQGILKARCPIEHIIVGGAPVAPDVEKAALEMRPDSKWWATYGMTETCSHVALRPFGEEQFRALPSSVFSTTPDGRLVITHSSASWSPVITTDIVTLIDSESFIYRGRADHAIISGGIKIHPEEVEKLIAPAMEGRRYYITGRQSVDWGTEVALVMEGEPDASLEAKLLTRADALAGSIRRPRSVIWLSSFPLTQSGKIIRKTF